MFGRLFVVLFFSLVVFAGCSIEGTITYNDYPLSGVTVQLSNVTPSKVAITNDSGNYTFAGLSNGSYVVTPILDCYEFDNESENVTISNRSKLNVDFKGRFACVNKCAYNAQFDYYKCSTEVAGVNRTFIYQEPEGAAPEDGYSVLLLFHGAGKSGEIWFMEKGVLSKSKVAFKNKAINQEKNYFIIAMDANNEQIQESPWPCNNSTLAFLGLECEPHWCYLCMESVKPTCCVEYDEFLHCDEDLLFIEEVLDKIDYSSNDSKNDPSLCLDPDRIELKLNNNKVFIAGISSGGGMTIYASRAFGNTRIKAGAVMVGGIAEDSVFPIETPENHPPMIILSGALDPFVAVHENYHRLLTESNVTCSFLQAQNKTHQWIAKFDDDIFNWFETYAE